jgi:hypothetical protein
MSREQRKEYLLDSDHLPNDDDLYEEAKAALDTIETILSDLPPRSQIAIVKALGVRIVILGELQWENPQTRPTLSA